MIWIASQFQKRAARHKSRGSCPKETEDYGDPGETRDPGEVQSSGCLCHEQTIFMTTGRPQGKCKIAGVCATNKLFLWQLECVVYSNKYATHTHATTIVMDSLHFHFLSHSLKKSQQQKMRGLTHTVKREKLGIPYWGLNRTAMSNPPNLL